MITFFACLYPFLPFCFCTPRGVFPVGMRARLLLNDIWNYIQLLSKLALYIVDRVTVKVNGHLAKGQSPPRSRSTKLYAEGTAAQIKLNIVSQTYDSKIFLKKADGHSNQKDKNVFSYTNVWARDLFI